MWRGFWALPIAILAVMAMAPARAEIITFESGGLKYKALTHHGVTIMFATLPQQIHNYSIIQVSISNGSPIAWAFRPEDFHFERTDGSTISGQPAESVVHEFSHSASHGDLVKLMAAYEAALFGNVEIHSSNGYEK